MRRQLLVIVALLTSPVLAQPEITTHERTLAQTHGVVAVRPADADTRERLGFSPPRASDQILQEIDDLTAQMRPIAARDEVWNERFREYRAMQRRRISLVSELEESGYEGNRLTAMLEQKLEDIGRVYSPRGWPWDSFGRERKAMAKRYAGTPVGARARAFAMLEQIHATTAGGFRVHPDDYPRLAEIELGWQNDPDAGLLLLEAMHFSKDEDLRTRWQDWILKNLPPESRGYRSVQRRRMFGSPIRLQGPALRGGSVDTEQWKGDVILVDFWGTWCAPCIAAMPHLKELETKYADRGLRIVGVLVDHEFDKARAFVTEKDYAWPQIIWEQSTPDNYGEHPIAHKYAVGGFPTLWLIDRAGVLVARVERENLEETVLEYLNQE